MPTYQTFTAPRHFRTARATRANEEASPGLYAIDDLAELAHDRRASRPATRTGVHEYTFDQAGTGSLVVDLRNNFGSRNGATLSVGTTAGQHLAQVASTASSTAQYRMVLLRRDDARQQRADVARRGPEHHAAHQEAAHGLEAR